MEEGSAVEWDQVQLLEFAVQIQHLPSQPFSLAGEQDVNQCQQYQESFLHLLQDLDQ